jgi:hypothetical protein
MPDEPRTPNGKGAPVTEIKLTTFGNYNQGIIVKMRREKNGTEPLESPIGRQASR